jgi:aminoglycoside phosphotransferase (APT) family kinase protein
LSATEIFTSDTAVIAALGKVISAQTGALVTVGGLKRYAVGFSWMTFGFTASGILGAGGPVDYILRLGSPNGLFAPYSVQPQLLSSKSLEGSTVPVPKVYWSSDDPVHLGAPYLICEKAEGAAVIPWAAEGATPLEEGYRDALAGQFVDALAGIHNLDWRGTPIAEMAGGITVQNAALKQVEEWEQNIARWATRPFPLLQWATDWLKDNCPEAPKISIIHGDYRTGNFLESGGKITSILDWELAHLGDPHEDIGWLSLPMYTGGSGLLCRLIEEEQFYRLYEEKAGFRVSRQSVLFYRAFSLYKLAATHIAASRCFEDGRMNDLRMPAMGSQIPTALRQMVKTIEAAS